MLSNSSHIVRRAFNLVSQIRLTLRIAFPPSADVGRMKPHAKGDSDMRILLAGKRNGQLEKMKRALERAHCSAECVFDRETALDLCMDDCYDCIALEAVPFCKDPLDVVSGIRDAGIETPIMMLLERGERRLGIAVLNAGADDFVTPPIAMAEFVARARALARRNGGFASQQLIWGDVTLDAQAFELRTASSRVHLGNREYQIMELLMRGRGRRICAEEIVQRVWGEENAGCELIWVHISALRTKMEKINAQTHICTYRGQGYALEV